MTSPPQWVSAEDAQAMVQAAVDQALAAHQASVSESASGSVSAEQVQALIAAAVAQQAEAHNEAMKGLMASLRGSVVSFVPEHAGGRGTDVHETWSQYEQELAYAEAQAARRAEAAAKAV